MEEPRVSVLIVEDNPSWQMNYRELLEDEGYFVQVASTRQQAELLLKEQRFDLAIIDIRLDESDPNNIEGIRLAERIEALETKLPVIMTSGYGDLYKVPVKEVRERIVDFIDKGEASAQRNLLDAVHRAIAIKRAEKEGLSEVGSLLREIIGKMVREYLDLPEIGLFILRKAAQFINAEHGNLLLVDGDEVVIAATTDGNLGARFDIDKCVTGLAVKRRATVNVPDVREEPYRSLFQPALGRDKRSELAVPAMMGEEVIAVLNFESPELGAFTEVDARQLEILAGPAAIAIDNARLHESLVRQARRVTVLSEISGEINSIIEKGEKEVAETAVDRMLSFMACDKAAIFSVDESKSKLSIIAHRRLSDEYVAGAKHLSVESMRATAVRTKEPLVVSDIQQDERFTSVRDLANQEGFRALLEEPLFGHGGRTLGSLVAYYSNERHFSEEEKGLAKTFAHHVAIAINNARQYEALERERRRRQLAAVGQLAGDMMHRVRSPLGHLLVELQMIELKCSEELASCPSLQKRLKTIQDDANEAMTMVAKVRKDALEMYLEDVDVNNVVSLTLEKLTLPPTIKLEVVLKRELPKARAGRKLGDVLTNLLTNAVDTMPQGGNLVVQTDASLDWVEIHVADAGRGIPEYLQEEVFQPYYSTKEGAGHGIGLWWSKAYVEAMGGEIRLMSQIGKGSVFTVCLPKATGREGSGAIVALS